MDSLVVAYFGLCRVHPLRPDVAVTLTFGPIYIPTMPVSIEDPLTSRRGRRRHRLASHAPASTLAPHASTLRSTEEGTKLLLISFRNGEAVDDHPDVTPYLDEGWRIRSASPRVTDKGTELLVVLE